MRLFRVALSIVTTVLVYGAFAFAQTNGQQSSTSISTATVPRLIQIKGSVRETGKPLSGTVGITFTLYKDADDQVAVWQEIQNVQLDSAGRYTVLLGATNEGGLPLEIFSAGEARWLGVRPDGQAEQPRISLSSVAYALKAADTEMLGGRPASSYVLAESQNPATQFATTTQAGAANSKSGTRTPRVKSGAGPLSESGCPGGVNSGGTSAGTIPFFTDGCDIDASIITQSGGALLLAGPLAGTNAAFTGTLNVPGNAFIGSPTGGTLNAPGGAIFAPLGTATTVTGYPSAGLDLEASSYFPGDGPVNYLFRWQATPVGNNSSTVNPGATLNLVYGVSGFLTQTGLSIAGNGFVNFATGQTYPGLFQTNIQNSAYTTTASDFASCSTIPVASGTFTVTLVASSSQPPSGQCVFIVNYGSGVVTIAGNGQKLNGSSANLTLAAGSAAAPNGAFVVSDGTNYVVQLFGGGGGGGTGTVTSVAETINSGSTSGIFTVTGSPIVTSGTLNVNLSGTMQGIPYFSSTKILSSSGALTGIVRGGLPPTASEISGDASTSGTNALTVKGLNGTLLSSLATGLLKNTTATGVPSIATSSDIVGLFGTCSGSQLLGADGKCHTVSGSGTVTSIATTSPITGGPITTSGTIGLVSCPSAGQTWIWSGTAWACGAAGGGGGSISGSGTPNGIAYFSGSTTNLTSTLAPINGQILIGSTGNPPVLGTLTAGANVSITNNPGSITISASGGGGSPTLPFFATAAQRTGANQAAGHNLTKVWGFLLPYNVTTTQLTYDVTTVDNTGNNYDIGIYDNSGNLVLNIGPTPGTTFAPSKMFKTMAWAQGSTSLLAGRYYIAFTTNCASACAAVAGDTLYVSFAVNASAGPSVGGALPSTMTPPADNWGTGNQPMLVLH
jgi:hypothetical protein